MLLKFLNSLLNKKLIFSQNQDINTLQPGQGDVGQQEITPQQVLSPSTQTLQPDSPIAPVQQNLGVNPNDPSTWTDLVIPVKLDSSTGLPRLSYEEAKAIQDYFYSNSDNINPPPPPVFDSNREKEGVKKAYLSQLADYEMTESQSFQWLSNALNVNILEDEDYSLTREQAEQEAALQEEKRKQEEETQEARVSNPVVQAFLETENGKKLLDFFIKRYGDSDALTYASDAIFDALGPPEASKKGGFKVDRRMEFFVYNPEYIPEEAKNLIEQNGLSIEDAQGGNRSSVQEKIAIINLLSASPYSNNMYQMLDFLASEGDDAIYNHVMSVARRGTTWKGRGEKDRPVSMEDLSGDPEKSRELGETDIGDASSVREEGMEAKINRAEQAKDISLESVQKLENFGQNVVETAREMGIDPNVKVGGASLSLLDLMENVLEVVEGQMAELFKPENEVIREKAKDRGVRFETEYKAGRQSVRLFATDEDGNISRDFSKIIDPQFFAKQINQIADNKEQVLELYNDAFPPEEISKRVGEDLDFVKQTIEDGPQAVKAYRKMKPSHLKSYMKHYWGKMIEPVRQAAAVSGADQQSVADFFNLFGVHGSFLQPFTDSDYEALNQIPGWQDMPVNEIIQNMESNGYIRELAESYNAKKPKNPKTEEQVANLVKKRLLGNKTSYKNTETLWNLKGDMPDHIREWLNWRGSAASGRKQSYRANEMLVFAACDRHDIRLRKLKELEHKFAKLGGNNVNEVKKLRFSIAKKGLEKINKLAEFTYAS